MKYRIGKNKKRALLDCDGNEIALFDPKYIDIAELVCSLLNNRYEKYVGQFAKRFYTPFDSNSIFQIVGYTIASSVPYFTMQDLNGDVWDWDVEDCVVITNESIVINDNRVANVNDSEYTGFNPFSTKDISNSISDVKDNLDTYPEKEIIDSGILDGLGTDDTPRGLISNKPISDIGYKLGINFAKIPCHSEIQIDSDLIEYNRQWYELDLSDDKLFDLESMKIKPVIENPAIILDCIREEKDGMISENRIPEAVIMNPKKIKSIHDWLKLNITTFGTETVHGLRIIESINIGINEFKILDKYQAMDYDYKHAPISEVASGGDIEPLRFGKLTDGEVERICKIINERESLFRRMWNYFKF